MSLPRANTIPLKSRKRKDAKPHRKTAPAASPRLDRLASPRYTTPKFQKSPSTAFQFVPIAGHKKSFNYVKSKYNEDTAKLNNIKEILDENERDIADKINLRLMNENEMQEIRESLGDISEPFQIAPIQIRDKNTNIQDNNKNANKFMSMMPSMKLAGTLTVVLISSVVSTIYTEVLKAIVVQYLTEIGIFSTPMTLWQSILNIFGFYHSLPMLQRIYHASLTNVKAQITLCFLASAFITITFIWIFKIIRHYCKCQNKDEKQALSETKQVQIQQAPDKFKRLSVPKHLRTSFYADLNNDEFQLIN